MALMHDVDAGARWAPALRALPDERLARMAEHGNDSAFSAIYARYSPVLHGYCRSLLRDEEEAGDALQNAMLKAMQAMRKARRTGPLRPWLFRIAHNESITIIRQRARRPGELDDTLVAGGGDAFRHASAREDLAGLLRDLESLTQYQRSALVMRELGGLSYDEIALALETTPLAARQAVFAAKRKLDPDRATSSRKRLKLLLPPAPAGFALLGGLFSGGGAAGGTGLLAKTLIATAAVSAVGVGSVEVVTHVPGAGTSAKQATASVARAGRSSARATRTRPAVAPGTPTVATSTTATAKAAAVAAPTATATATASGVGGRLVGAIVAQSAPSSSSSSSAATPTPQATATPERVPAAASPAPTPNQDSAQPVDRPAGGYGGHPAAGFAGRDRQSGRGYGNDAPAASATSAPAPAPAADQAAPAAPVATAPQTGFGGGWTRGQPGVPGFGGRSAAAGGAPADGAAVGSDQ